MRSWSSLESPASAFSFTASCDDSPDAFWFANSTGCARIGLAGFRNHVMPWCDAASISARAGG
ncbi:hypothetical protein SAMN05421837_103102 [Amycolatopsis pretoriensis]|uniref:Uncharacterized protein n=1 Tax=Amycolatopsis pretoriensis TaxID=218821 RepID=A0A1H5QLS2_9PSEU|nr:hypothetical protein SAMN05421837_103102 [Amycolatopsis pretoriensis]